MGKKGKKGAGKKKGSKSSTASSTERKKVEEPKMTMEEARLAFLINVKKRSCDEFEKELDKLKLDRECLREKNRRLKIEQLRYVKDLAGQMKEQDAEAAQAATVAREHVEEAIREKLQAARDAENDIKKMKERIQTIKLSTEDLKREVKLQERYKDVGQHKDREQINLLEETLMDWQRDLEQTEKDLKKSLKLTRREINEQAEEQIGTQRHTAAEYAISHLDRGTRKQIIENERLHREIKIHRDAVGVLRLEVEGLEKRNLDMLTEMMKNAGDELAIATQFYMPRVEHEEDDENDELDLTHDDDETGTYSSTDEEHTPDDDHHLTKSEIASLYVVGKGLKPENSEANEGASAKSPGKWPVTANMLKSVLSTS
ncbi:myosin-3-like [Corticium candelabrum]|uniref:myosin-3-like n=1 Tax=Corticium candelabrum TaxID=121492 RepID=UPI002E272303|nr:myosin-3-like [Corticium candelabrum]